MTHLRPEEFKYPIGDNMITHQRLEILMGSASDNEIKGIET